MKPTRLQASTVIFDVGNTLHHIDYEFIAATITKHDRPITAAEVNIAEYTAKAAIDALLRDRQGGDEAFRQFSYFGTMLEALEVASDQRATIAAALAAENQQRLLWRVLHPTTPPALAKLQRRGFKLAVVSNADGRVERALRDSGIARFFESIIDSSIVGVEKPDARIFELALTACDADAADSIYVGDIYEIDVRGARNAGMEAVLLDPLDRYGPVDCTRIKSLAELPGLLDGPED